MQILNDKKVWLKVGDKIQVRKDLKKGMKIAFGVTKEMEKYAGKICTIDKIRRTKGGMYDNKINYRIKEDNGYWAWSINAFVLREENEL